LDNASKYNGFRVYGRPEAALEARLINALISGFLVRNLKTEKSRFFCELLCLIIYLRSRAKSDLHTTINQAGLILNWE
jgi:hypothetical protein